MSEKVILAFSGGLDTSVCVKLLEEKYDAEVITACVDVGQPEEDIKRAETVAKKIGNSKHVTIDAKEEFADDYISKGIKANALYEGYPLSTSLARPLIAMKIIELAKKENATAIAHGCTGKGNDQFRFEGVIRAMSDLNIIAPIRDLNLTRSEEQAYAKEKGIPISPDSAFSIDENIWGRSIEGDLLENPINAPIEEAYEWTKSIADAKDDEEIIAVEFESGIPIAINGEKKKLIDLISVANKVAGEHGIGRIDIIEDRIVGLKSREIYEVPGATLLIAAHKGLEQLVLSKSELQFLESVSPVYADLVYSALWQDPLKEDLDVLIDNMQRRVTGKVNLKVFKGRAAVITRESKYSLHDIEQISFEDKTHDQKEIEGMIKHHGLQAAIYQKVIKK
ncbi:argininosuccinate synthase [Methanobrevibacter curvatus]|uniref:Argininosuccinate synthase n=1 Tax=Methanobrevibacter curvatus TaxID=49547 RepID=A0A166C5N5_9EURY|nr:argininosuccinate synthase [Methanobrevibacter curvatus]KZX14155.1 argininosuccinate synthase [Methanobrevibacter curvatus]